MTLPIDHFIHVYQPPAEDGPEFTLLLLHDTGGDENNLLQIGEMLAPGAGLLSPRGQIKENGTTNRWFKRVAMGVFDEHTTRWQAENEFRFSGLMAIMAIFMRGNFPKETQKSMEAFKTYAESRE